MKTLERKMPSEPKTGPSGKYHFALILILLFAFAIGLVGLNADIVWMDEMYSLANMGAFESPYNPAQVVASLAEYSSDHVPLYFLFGSQWGQLAGWSQVAMRYLSLLFGILLITMSYRFAADMFNRRLALTVAFLLSTSTILLWYFHEIRMYTLLMFLTVAQTWLYFRLVSGFRASRWTWAIFVATASALIYTHVFTLFFFFGLFIQHCLFISKSCRWRAILLGWAFAALTFLPYLPTFVAGFSKASLGHPRSLPTAELITSFAHILVNGAPLLWVFIIVLLGLAVRWGKAQDTTVLRLATIVVTVILSLVVLNAILQTISITRLRYFMIVQPFIIIMFAYLLLEAYRLRVILALFALLWLASGYYAWSQAENWMYVGHHTLLLDNPPIHRYSDALQFKTREHDTLFSTTNAGTITWRLKHGYTTIEYYIDTLLGIDGAFVSAKITGGELSEEYRKQVAASPYLLFAYEKDDKPANFDEVLALLQADYRACGTLADEQDIFIERYVDKALTCDRAYAPIQYDNGITIIDKFADYDEEQKTVRVVTGAGKWLMKRNCKNTMSRCKSSRLIGR